ncbi:MAG: trigger factor [Thioalkalivibrionaceae bacterium]
MQVSLQETGAIDREMTVQIPRERVDAEVDKRLESLRRRVKIDGFRPGKVPLKVVRSRYAAGVLQEVISDLVQETYIDAIREQQVSPVGGPTVEARPFEESGPIEYVARFQVFPKIDIATFNDLTIESPEVEIEDADVDRVIDSLRQQNREFKAVDRVSQSGDRLTIDFSGTIDGEAFEGGSAKAMQVEVGGGRMLPDFEQALEGVKAGDEKTIDVAFPEDYPAENLRGKTAQFVLNVHSVEAPELPEIDEAFARKFGIEDGDVGKLRAEVRANMQRELDQAIKARVKNQVMDALVERHVFELPQALIQGEIDRLRQEMEQRFGGAKNNQPLPDQVFQATAERRVRLGLVVRSIVDQQNIKVDAARVEREIEVIASTYEEPEEVERYYASQPEARSSIESLVLEDQVVEWVSGQANTTSVKKDFQSFMNPAPKPPEGQADPSTAV